MRTLSTRFNLKVSLLEERPDLDNLAKDEMYWILMTYEMRIECENASRNEATFKSTRKPNSSKNECKNIEDLSYK